MAVEGEQVGDAKILNTLSEAFTLEGLFDHYADEAAFDDDQLAEDAEAMAEE
jgi:nuclear GTP-binding protein